MKKNISILTLALLLCLLGGCKHNGAYTINGAVSMPGFDGMIPPEVGGGAMVYSILNAEKLHGSGVIISDVLNAMDFPYPVQETAPKKGGPKGHRLSDMELTMAFCTMGPGFDGPEKK